MKMKPRKTFVHFIIYIIPSLSGSRSSHVMQKSASNASDILVILSKFVTLLFISSNKIYLFRFSLGTLVKNGRLFSVAKRYGGKA